MEKESDKEVSSADDIRKRLITEAKTRKWKVKILPLTQKILSAYPMPSTTTRGKGSRVNRSSKRKRSVKEATPIGPTKTLEDDWLQDDDESDDSCDDADEAEHFTPSEPYASIHPDDFELIPIEFENTEKRRKRSSKETTSKPSTTMKSSKTASKTIVGMTLPPDSPAVILDDDDEDDDENEVEVFFDVDVEAPSKKRQKTCKNDEKDGDDIVEIGAKKTSGPLMSAHRGAGGESGGSSVLKGSALENMVVAAAKQFVEGERAKENKKTFDSAMTGGANFNQIYDAVKRHNAGADRKASAATSSPIVIDSVHGGVNRSKIKFAALAASSSPSCTSSSTFSMASSLSTTTHLVSSAAPSSVSKGKITYARSSRLNTIKQSNPYTIITPTTTPVVSSAYTTPISTTTPNIDNVIFQVPQELKEKLLKQNILAVRLPGRSDPVPIVGVEEAKRLGLQATLCSGSTTGASKALSFGTPMTILNSYPDSTPVASQPNRGPSFQGAPTNPIVLNAPSIRSTPIVVPTATLNQRSSPPVLLAATTLASVARSTPPVTSPIIVNTSSVASNASIGRSWDERVEISVVSSNISSGYKTKDDEDVIELDEDGKNARKSTSPELPTTSMTSTLTALDPLGGAASAADGPSHGLQQNKVPHCLLCKKKFLSWTYLEEHIATTHYSLPLYNCLNCSTYYYTSLNVCRHMNEAHKPSRATIVKRRSFDVVSWADMTTLQAISLEQRNQRVRNFFILNRKEQIAEEEKIMHDGTSETLWKSQQVEAEFVYFNTLKENLPIDCPCVRCKRLDEMKLGAALPDPNPNTNTKRSERMLENQKEVRKMKQEMTVETPFDSNINTTNYAKNGNYESAEDVEILAATSGESSNEKSTTIGVAITSAATTASINDKTSEIPKNATNASTNAPINGQTKSKTVLVSEPRRQTTVNVGAANNDDDIVAVTTLDSGAQNAKMVAVYLDTLTVGSLTSANASAITTTTHSSALAATSSTATSTPSSAFQSHFLESIATTRTEESWYSCTKCSECFSTERLLISHKVIAHGNDVMECDSSWHLTEFTGRHISSLMADEEKGAIEDRVPPERLWAVVKLMNGETSSVEELTHRQGIEDQTMSFYRNAEEMFNLMSISLNMSVDVLLNQIAQSREDRALYSQESIYKALCNVGGTQMMCPLCPWIKPRGKGIFAGDEFVKDHFASDHPREYVELYVCESCGKWSRRHCDLIRHIKNGHSRQLTSASSDKAEYEEKAEAMAMRVFSHRVDPDEEDEDYEISVQRVGWFSEVRGDMAPIILYNCKLCLVTLLQPIHMHFHLLSDHGVEMRMLRNFYKVVDRSDDDYNRYNYETERCFKTNQDPLSISARLWFLCYMCGTIMGQEVDLKAHLVSHHRINPPIFTLVVQDHMVFREERSGGMDLGAAIANSTRVKMLKTTDDESSKKKKKKMEENERRRASSSSPLTLDERVNDALSGKAETIIARAQKTRISEMAQKLLGKYVAPTAAADVHDSKERREEPSNERTEIQTNKANSPTTGGKITERTNGDEVMDVEGKSPANGDEVEIDKQTSASSDGSRTTADEAIEIYDTSPTLAKGQETLAVDIEPTMNDQEQEPASGSDVTPSSNSASSPADGLLEDAAAANEGLSEDAAADDGGLLENAADDGGLLENAADAGLLEDATANEGLLEDAAANEGLLKDAAASKPPSEEVATCSVLKVTSLSEGKQKWALSLSAAHTQTKTAIAAVSSPSAHFLTTAAAAETVAAETVAAETVAAETVAAETVAAESVAAKTESLPTITASLITAATDYTTVTAATDSTTVTAATCTATSAEDSATDPITITAEEDSDSDTPEDSITFSEKEPATASPGLITENAAIEWTTAAVTIAPGQPLRIPHQRATF